MTKQHLNPPTLFQGPQYGFSQIVVASGGRSVFISGQVAWDSNQRIVGENLGDQARQALRNLETAVRAAGGTLHDIVCMRIYVVERARTELAEIASALREFFPANPPASSWIGVSFLAVPEFLVEIEAQAVLEWAVENP